MGWRFRKVWGSGPFRWTLSKRGVGWSVGLPGMRYGISPTGQRYISVGIPGTGIYWIKHFPLHSGHVGSIGLPQVRNATTLPGQPTSQNVPQTPPSAAPSTPAPKRWWQQKGLGP